MITEQEAETFSAEDAPNVVIPCALSAITYDLMTNFKAILDSKAAKQHKIKLFDALGAICEN